MTTSPGRSTSTTGVPAPVLAGRTVLCTSWWSQGGTDDASGPEDGVRSSGAALQLDESGPLIRHLLIRAIRNLWPQAAFPCRTAFRARSDRRDPYRWPRRAHDGQ